MSRSTNVWFQNRTFYPFTSDGRNVKIVKLIDIRSAMLTFAMLTANIPPGASWLSKEFLRGAEFTGKAVHKGATKLRTNMTPEETPVEISPKVTKGLQAAQQATGGAARVSRFLGTHRPHMEHC